ncbi:anti-sigma factor domain-containing protein [Microbacterium sp. P05]|uniref:anti-sigma factor n=1 Tax=Microbacterium sp. P05 TaxID=3366948 RepID=UPI00374624DD
MNETTFAELAAGYALNALSDADRDAFETALAAHPEWAAYLQADSDTVLLLSDSVAPVMPPAPVRSALLARIASTPQTPDAASQPAAIDEEDYAAAGPAPVVPTTTRAGAGMRRRWFTLAASIVVVLALGVGTVVIGQQLARPAAVVALDQIQDAPDAASATVELTDGGAATLHWSASLGDAVLVSDGLPSLASDETFELWLVRDDAAIAAGTFTTDDGSAMAALAADYQSGDIIAVTVEPAGGAPEGVPTSEPILAIATA